MRTLFLAITCAALLGGCPPPRVATDDAHFVGLTARATTVLVRVRNAAGSSATLSIEATVMGTGIEWASLAPADLVGTIRRAEGDTVELSIAADTIVPDACFEATCNRLYDVTLDAAPSEPWDLVVSAAIDGEDIDADRVSIEVLAHSSR